MSETWTIGELAERAASLLGRKPHHDGQEQRGNGGEQRDNDREPRGNGRVREVPNERLIRWYTTIGLLDPPLGRRGRVALYGRRHLLQLVAVKRRQAEGQSIAAIQAELAGATDAMLQRVAGLTEPPPERPPRPASLPLAPSSSPPSSSPPAPGWCGTRPEAGTTPAIPDVARPAARDRFWARPPSTHGGTTHGGTTLASAVPADIVQGVRLAPGVTVLLDPAYRAPDVREVAALRRAAAPLLTALATLGLAGPFDGAHDTRDTRDTADTDAHAPDPLEG